MIGNIDEAEDWLATGICIRGGINASGQDSRSFLTGHHLGFILGWVVGRKDRRLGTAQAAYAEAIAHIKRQDGQGRETT